MRTEEEILNDFEEMKFKVIANNEKVLYLESDFLDIIFYKQRNYYEVAKHGVIKMQVHKLLNELISAWHWL